MTFHKTKLKMLFLLFEVLTDFKEFLQMREELECLLLVLNTTNLLEDFNTSIKFLVLYYHYFRMNSF